MPAGLLPAAAWLGVLYAAVFLLSGAALTREHDSAETRAETQAGAGNGNRKKENPHDH